MDPATKHWPMGRDKTSVEARSPLKFGNGKRRLFVTLRIA